MFGSKSTGAESVKGVTLAHTSRVDGDRLWFSAVRESRAFDSL